jgi:PTH1 family peptidyl-tRNA hydrolase
MKSLWSSQNAALEGFLITGLGNPGSAYAATRHNIGFAVVRHFAKKNGLKFSKVSKLSGEVAQGQVEGAKVVLLLPLTYMNSSGESVRRCFNYFKPQLAKTVVVSDDVALPFGAMRLKEGGSAGGHNGLKSVEQHLGTQAYPRLRIGVGRPEGEVLADYVLGPFTPEEKRGLPEVLEKAASILELWMAQGIKAAMNVSNTK